MMPVILRSCGLYACTPAGPRPGANSFQRGGPVAVWNDHVETNLRVVADEIDVAAAREVWTAATAARHEIQPVWVHGDVTGTNLLVREGRLAAVIDFGCSAYGDPACDLTIAWTFLAGAARDRTPADQGSSAGANEPGRVSRGAGV